MAKIRIDFTKPKYGILGLLKEPMFHLTTTLPTLIFSISLILLVFLVKSFLEFNLHRIATDEGISLFEVTVLFYGYALNVIFTVLLISLFIRSKKEKTIHKSRTIIISLGLMFFSIAIVSIGFLILFFYPLFTIFEIDANEFGNVFSGTFYWAIAPFLAWCLGGFIVDHIILINRVNFWERYTHK